MPPEIEIFLNYLAGKDLAIGTMAQYRAALKLFFEWFMKTTNQIDLTAVTPLDVRHYRDELKKRQKGRTINNKMGKISVFFRWCIKEGKIASDPTENLKPAKVVVSAPKWLTKAETYTVLRMADQQLQVAQTKGLQHSVIMAARTVAMIRLMLNAGLRVSEICDLKLDDITIAERSGGVLIRYGKGGKQREVPLNLDARKAIDAWLKVRGDGEGFLFIGPDGEQLNRLVVNWHVTQLGKKAGVDLHPHRLRHTFGKNLVDNGVPLDRVAMLLGHTSLTTTAIYTMPSQGDLQRAVDKIAWEE